MSDPMTDAELQMTKRFEAHDEAMKPDNIRAFVEAHGGDGTQFDLAPIYAKLTEDEGNLLCGATSILEDKIFDCADRIEELLAEVERLRVVEKEGAQFAFERGKQAGELFKRIAALEAELAARDARIRELEVLQACEVCGGSGWNYENDPDRYGFFMRYACHVCGGTGRKPAAREEG